MMVVRSDGGRAIDWWSYIWLVVVHSNGDHDVDGAIVVAHLDGGHALE